MKFIDKLKQEHPLNVGKYHTGGAVGCPCDYGYEKGPACVRVGQKTLTCRECWEREISEGGKETAPMGA